MKLLIIIAGLIALIAVTEGKNYTYAFQLRIDTSESKPFRSTGTVELNFEDGKNETFVGEMLPSSSSWWSFEESLTQTVDKVKSVRFQYVSHDSADDTFVLNRLYVGQYFFRHRYIYYRSFAIDGVLKQNTWYTGYPDTKKSL